MIYHIRAPLICTLSPISLSPPLSASFYCCKKLPQMWWFKKNTHKNTSVFFHSSGVQNSKIKVSTELHSFYRIWKRTLLSPGFWGAAGIPWLPGLVVTLLSLCLWSHCLLCASSPFLSCVRTLVIGFKAHLDNPGRSHHRSRNLITCSKIFFFPPKKLTFTGFGD